MYMCIYMRKYVCRYFVWVCMCILQHVYRDQGTILETQFSPTTTWVQDIEF